MPCVQSSFSPVYLDFYSTEEIEKIRRELAPTSNATYIPLPSHVYMCSVCHSVSMDDLSVEVSEAKLLTYMLNFMYLCLFKHIILKIILFPASYISPLCTESFLSTYKDAVDFFFMKVSCLLIVGRQFTMSLSHL